MADKKPAPWANLFKPNALKGISSNIVNKERTSKLASMTGGFVLSSDPNNALFKRLGLDLVKVDLKNDSRKGWDVSKSQILHRSDLSPGLVQTFDASFDSWLSSVSNGLTRQERMNDLRFIYSNHTDVSAAVKQSADAASQTGEDGRLIQVNSEDPLLANVIYELMDSWGLNQDKAFSICRDLELYGEAVCLTDVSHEGVRGIRVVPVTCLVERLEFDPLRSGEDQIAVSRGLMNTLDTTNKESMIKQMLNKYAQFGDDAIASLMRSRLFGYVFNFASPGSNTQTGQQVYPPWSVIHFRLDADGDYAPYGTPYLLSAIPSIKQYMSVVSLHGVSLQQSLPRMVFKVTLSATEAEMGPTQIVEAMRTIKSQYMNLGLSGDSFDMDSVGSSFWMPEGLLALESFTPETKDLIPDLEFFAKQAHKATGGILTIVNGAPGSSEASGISLIEQSKIGARSVAKTQAALLEGIHSAIRLHLAITGAVDYRVPFSLTMRTPIESMGEEERNAKKESLDVASSILELIKDVSGVEAVGDLPTPVIKSILNNFSLLGSVDLATWFSYIESEKLMAELENEDYEEESSGGDFGEDEGFDELGEGTNNKKIGVDYTSLKVSLQETALARDKFRQLPEGKKKTLREAIRILNSSDTKASMRFKFAEILGKSGMIFREGATTKVSRGVDDTSDHLMQDIIEMHAEVYQHIYPHTGNKKILRERLLSESDLEDLIESEFSTGRTQEYLETLKNWCEETIEKNTKKKDTKDKLPPPLPTPAR